MCVVALTASAQTNPPATGDWDIYDDTSISGRSITIQGSVVVHSGGRLTLTGVDIKVTPSGEGGATFTVQGSGRLIWKGGSLASANPNHYTFIAQSASSVEMDGVTVSGMWQNRGGMNNPDSADRPASIVGGFQIASSTVTVSNCTFRNNDRVAMTITGASPIIRNTYFYKSAYFSYYRASYAYLNRDAYGIISVNGNPRIEGCTFAEMGDWDTAFNDYNPSYSYTYLSLEGHGIYASRGAPQVIDCMFTDMGRTPTSSYYYIYVGGRYVYFYFYQTNLRACVRGYENMMLTVRDCNFTGNYQGYQDAYDPIDAAYAVAIEGGKANVKDCLMLHNGGGALLSSASELVFTNVSVLDFNDFGIVLRGGGTQKVHDVVLNGTLEERNKSDEVGVYFDEATAVFDVYDLNITFVYYGVQADGTALAKIRDTYIANTTRKIYANNARIDCHNVTASPSECELGWYQSEINLYFNLELLVTWQNGLRIPMAVVQVFNDTDGLILAVQSNKDGWVPPITLLQSKVTGTSNAKTTTNNDPIKISAFANGTRSDVYVIPFQNNTFFHLIVWDKSPPTVVIYSPRKDHAQNTTRLEVRGVAFDFGSGLLGVEVSTDGQSWERANGWLTWNLTLELEEGVYDLQVKGLDVGGGSAITVIANVTIDLTAPWLQIAQPKQTVGIIYTNSTSITISGQAEIGADVFVNGDMLNLVGGSFYTQRSFSSEGMNTYEVMAVDKVGNRNVTVLYVYQDITDPVLIIEHPEEDFITNDRVLQVSGLTDREVSITINGVDVPVTEGLFTLAMTLEEGTNIIRVEAVDLAQNHRSTTLSVVYDTQPPRLTMTFPSKDVAVNTSNVVVSGSVDADVATVRVNHVPVTVVNGRFSKNFKLDEGDNIIRIDVVDRAGNEVARSYVVTLDTEAPFLDITNPVDGSYATTRSVVVTGRVEVGAVVTLNGAVVNVTGGYIHVPLTLEETPPGGIPNAITVVATDTVGNQATATVRVVADTKAPRLVLYDTPPRVSTDFFNLSGTVSDPFDLVELSVNGAPVEPNADGFFEAFVGLSLGNNTLTVRAVDRAGNVAVQSVSISRESIRVKDEGIMGLGDWSWLLLLLFLGVGLVVAFASLWALSRREVGT